MPRRAYAKQIVEMLNNGKSDDAVVAYIRKTYRLVLLTPQEMHGLNQINRSRLTKDRISDAGIKLCISKRKASP